MGQLSVAISSDADRHCVCGRHGTAEDIRSPTHATAWCVICWLALSLLWIDCCAHRDMDTCVLAACQILRIVDCPFVINVDAESIDRLDCEFDHDQTDIRARMMWLKGRCLRNRHLHDKILTVRGGAR